MSATTAARTLVEVLIAGGVTEVVLAPGSRNAPLAFAVHAAARAGLVRLHTRFDERTAGFLALGLTKVGARAAVICTSGTAVANLHPAVMEAAHSGLPLVVVTADRPASLRGTGASQTTDQVGVFGAHARCVDLDHGFTPTVVADLLGGTDAPVQLNLQLVPPLVPPLTPQPGEPDPSWPAPAAATAAVTTARLAPPARLAPGPRTVVVAGDDAGPAARILAEQGGWPLLAEPTSGSRTGPNALRCYRLLLDGPLAQQVQRVVVAGHPTLSRPVTRLLERADVEVVSVRHRGLWARRPFPVDAEYDALAAEADDPSWLEEWQRADRRLCREVDRLLAGEPDLTPHEVAAAVSAAVPPTGLLFLGASSPIRDLDLTGRVQAVGERRLVLANRGLAGIDGTVSSAIGAALGRPHGRRNLALMGDLTFLHDSTGLFLGPDEPEPDLTIVVVNDDGGSIFTMLEQGAPEYADSYDRLFGTPHRADLASLCAASRTPHLAVRSLPELEQALRTPNGGVEVIEVAVRRDNRRELDLRLRALVDQER